MRPALVAALLLGLSAQARAEDATELVVDPARTNLTFHAQTTFHPFDGNAPGASGTLTLSAGRPVAGTVEFPVARLQSGSDARDADMRGPGYLDARTFGTVRFQLASFSGPAVPTSGEATGTLQGTLQVKGVRRELSVPVKYGWAQGRLEVRGTFPLDIRDFGVPVPVVFLVQRMEPRVQVEFIVGFRPP